MRLLQVGVLRVECDFTVLCKDGKSVIERKFQVPEDRGHKGVFHPTQINIFYVSG
jgi:hypothetical protein